MKLYLNGKPFFRNMKALLFKLLFGFAFGNIVWINGEEFIRPGKSIPEATEVRRIFNMTSARDCIQITKSSQNLEIKVVTAIRTEFGYDCLIPLVRIRVKDLEDSPGRVTIFMHDKFKLYGDRFYEIHDDDFNDAGRSEIAYQKCKELGAHLIVIESNAILKHVLDLMNRNAKDLEDEYWVAYWRGNNLPGLGGYIDGWRMPNGTIYTGEVSPDTTSFQCSVLRYHYTYSIWTIQAWGCNDHSGGNPYYICQRE